MSLVPLLSVSNLSVGFGANPKTNEVVQGVTFDLAAGETLAIVGESGSGKSVTALAINRLVDYGGGSITKGSVRLQRANGTVIELAEMPRKELTRIRGGEIGMIFQEPMTSLNPVLTIGRQIEESFTLHRGLTGRQARMAAKEALERVRIPDAARRLDATPNQLSGGMLQRVMIAMALACNPRLLIADEPTTALDVTVQAQIMALLAELKRETGMAMIFITHDIGLVAGIADRVMVMQGGKAVEQGALGRVLDQPEHPYTVHLLNAVPHFSGGRAARADGQRAKPTAPALKVEGLVVRYPVSDGWFNRSAGAIHAVDGVDFDLLPGETLAIVGESGSGKSTTARAILGLAPKTRGDFVLSKRTAAAGDSNRPVQMVFQNPYASLNPRLTVKSILAEPLVASGRAVDAAAVARMAMLLKRVGLPENSLERYPHQFSGGQRQRLCIARALMLNPSVLVLDEPVSALDVSVQARVLELLVDLQREFGLAYLFISHDMAVVERIAHRIAVIYAGEIVEIGDAKSVLADPKHAYTRKLIAAVPTIERRNERFEVDSSQVPSLLRPPGFEPAAARWIDHGTDHKVRVSANDMSKGASPPTVSDARFDRAFAALQESVDTGRIPGGVLGVVDREGNRRIRSTGHAQRVPNLRPMRDDTWFDLASLTKVIFTTPRILALAEAGTIDLDAPLTTLLPDLCQYDPNAWERKVAFRHCLGHLTPFPAVEPIYTYGRDPELLRAFILQREWRKLAEPVYSDINFILLGFALERHFGCSIRAMDAGPGFAFAADPETSAATEDCTWRLRVLSGEVHDDNCSALQGAGHAGLFGTAASVLDFAQGLLDGTGASPAAIALMRQPLSAKRTHGWEHACEGWSGGNRCSAKTIGHTGFTGTGLWIDFDAGHAWTLLTNRIHPTRHFDSGIVRLRHAVGDRINGA